MSSKETCSNIMNFINTVIVEIRNRELFKDTPSSPLETSNDPNDDSQDYTPELNEWIESFEHQQNAFDIDVEKTNIVEEGGISLELKENSIKIMIIKTQIIIKYQVPPYPYCLKLFPIDAKDILVYSRPGPLRLLLQ